MNTTSAKKGNDYKTVQIFDCDFASRQADDRLGQKRSPENITQLSHIIMGNLGRSVTNTLAMVMSLVLVNRGVMYMKTYNEKLYNHI